MSFRNDRALAAQLNIPDYSKMRASELKEAVDKKLQEQSNGNQAQHQDSPKTA